MGDQEQKILVEALQVYPSRRRIKGMAMEKGERYLAYFASLPKLLPPLLGKQVGGWISTDTSINENIHYIKYIFSFNRRVVFSYCNVIPTKGTFPVYTSHIKEKNWTLGGTVQ